MGAADFRSTCRRLPCGHRGRRALAGSKDDSLRFLEWIESWFRDLLVYSVTRNPQVVVNVDMLPQIQQQSATADCERLFSRIAEAKAAVGGIQRNLNRRMVIEDLLLNTVEAS